jgi:Cft2 family RNA processing exonuclease
MKFYKDKELKEEITNGYFDGGIVDVGTTEEYDIYIKNDTGGLSQDISFSLEPDKEKYDEKEIEIVKEECEILSYPKSMKINESGVLKISYSPSGELKKGLKIKISAKEQIVYT